MIFKLTEKSIEAIITAMIVIVLGFVVFKNDEPLPLEVEVENFDEYPLTAWQTEDRHGGECVKVKYRVEKKNTRLYMFNSNGKKVHQQPISLSPYNDGRDRVETYVWKLYRTEWTDKISPGEYLIIVGTDYDKAASRNLNLKIDIL